MVCSEPALHLKKPDTFKHLYHIGKGSLGGGTEHRELSGVGIMLTALNLCRQGCYTR